MQRDKKVSKIHQSVLYAPVAGGGGGETAGYSTLHRFPGWPRRLLTIRSQRTNQLQREAGRNRALPYLKSLDSLNGFLANALSLLLGGPLGCFRIVAILGGGSHFVAHFSLLRRLGVQGVFPGKIARHVWIRHHHVSFSTKLMVVFKVRRSYGRSVACLSVCMPGPIFSTH